MKYNVGDKVIEIENLGYLTNMYHFKKALTAVQEVRLASVEKFTTDRTIDAEELNWPCGMNKSSIHSQADGRAYYGKGIKLHLEKDKNVLCAMVLKYINDFLSEEELDGQEQIIKMESQIEELEARIKDIKDNGPNLLGTKIKSREFAKERLEDITKVLGL